MKTIWMVLAAAAWAGDPAVDPWSAPPAVAETMAARFPGWTVESVEAEQDGFELRLRRDGRWVEAELDRDGRVVELEALLPPELVPPEVRAVVAERRPTGTVVAAKAEREGGGLVYEVLLREGGNLVEAAVRTGGEPPGSRGTLVEEDDEDGEGEEDGR